ncbi:MAG: TRAP transporter small permease subunit [Gammaproteobacteria bacterium]|nr:TRAP transporter small permease subunit [Gammaproteobacteria bacterium]
MPLSNQSVSRLQSLARLCDATNERVGTAISWLTVTMVAVTFLVVILRYMFNMGWIAMQESITFMHAFVFMLGAAYTLKHDGHVRVDIFYLNCAKRTRAWIDIAGTCFLLMPMMFFILYVSWEYVATSWSLLEESSEAGGMPGFFVLKSTIVAMPILMIIQGIAQIIHNALFLNGIEPEPEHHHAGEIK